jgi:hypothetical protein
MNYDQALEQINNGKKVRWSRFRNPRDYVFKTLDVLSYASHSHSDSMNERRISPCCPDPRDRSSETWELWGGHG